MWLSEPARPPVVEGHDVGGGLSCSGVPQPGEVRRHVAEPPTAALHAQAGHDQQLLAPGVVDARTLLPPLLLLRFLLLPVTALPPRRWTAAVTSMCWLCGVW